MNNIPVSVFLGPLFLIVFFVVCLICVAGVKTVYFYFKSRSESPKPDVKRVHKPAQPKEKPVRSIEINPDEVDKIYVKKVS